MISCYCYWCHTSPFLYLLSVCQGQLEDSSDEECCLPAIPIQPYFDTLPHNRTGGVQAILPYHKFNCEGVINHIVVQTKGESSRLDVQLWSPSESRIYSLKWSVSFSADENSVFQEVQPPNTEHDGSLLVFYSQRGLPVSPGDVLGYYIEQPIQLGFVDTGKVPGAQHSVIYALENVTAPVCSMSLCDAGLRSFYHAAPLIHAEFGKPCYKNDSQASCIQCIVISSAAFRFKQLARL